MNTKKSPITPMRRRTLAMARLLTNIRQLLNEDPSGDIIMLIEQHTTLLAAMYRHHAALSEAQHHDANLQAFESSPCNDHRESDPQSHQSDETPTPSCADNTATTPESPHTPSSVCDDTATGPDVKKTAIRLPRKLKKKLQSLPVNHPLRRRYDHILSVANQRSISAIASRTRATASPSDAPE